MSDGYVYVAGSDELGHRVKIDCPDCSHSVIMTAGRAEIVTPWM